MTQGVVHAGTHKTGTTRAREGWVGSVHGHLLRSIQMPDDSATFHARFPALSSPVEEAKPRLVFDASVQAR